MTDLKQRVTQQRPGNNGGGNGNAQQKSGGELVLDRKVATTRSLLHQMKGEFAVALPQHVSVDRFIRMALTCVRKNPALLDCEAASLIAALMEAARLGLEPGTKQAAIVPFGKQAQFIAQWQGLVELMYRSGQVASVTADFIHQGDEWDYSVGDGGRFYHRPNLLADDRGPVLLAYAFAEIKGGSRSRVILLNRRDAIEIRDEFSKSYQRAENNRKNDPKHFQNNPDWSKYHSTWHTHFDAMWRKSAVRRLADWVPQSPELRELLSRETEAGEMNPLADLVIPGDEIVDGEVIDDSAEPNGPAPGDG